MLNLIWIIAAITLEVSSWILPGFAAEGTDAVLSVYLLLHAGASLALAICLYPLLHDKHKHKHMRLRWAMLSLIASFSFVVPVVGFFAALWAVLKIRAYPVHTAGQPFTSIVLPAFDPYQQLQIGGRSAGMRAFLNNRTASTQSRLKALVALNHVSGRVASPLLRDVLNDHNDELRLLAYGMLDRMEQKLSNAIQHESQVLQETQMQSQHPGTPLSSRGLLAAYRLSELYWEMIYQKLAVDDLHDFAVQESLRYCDMVLAQIGDHGPLMLRRGRLLHMQGQHGAAAQCYEKALALGLPDTRVRPYQAQLCFEQGDFPKVQRLMRSMQTHNAQPKLRPVIDYWS